MPTISNVFPSLPERTRLFRRFRTHQDWTDRFLASPTLLGVVDTYGIELIHPIREGRRPGQIGKKGKSNYRWIVGGKLCLVLNKLGLVAVWDCDTANIYDTTFHPLIERFDEQMVVLGDTGFHSAESGGVASELCGLWSSRPTWRACLQDAWTTWSRRWDARASQRAWCRASARSSTRWSTASSTGPTTTPQGGDSKWGRCGPPLLRRR